MASVVDPRMTDARSWAAEERPAADASPGVTDHVALDDVSLVERIRSGDRASEAELYRRYARAIGETALSLLGSQSEAQDVLQDTFIDAFEQIARLKNTASVRAWLFGIAIHKVQRRFRRRKFLAALGLDRDGGDSFATDCPPEVRAEIALLERTLTSLTAAQRVAWMLRRVQGYTLEEVAEACGCSLATTKRRILAADEKVRMHFTDPKEEG